MYELGRFSRDQQSGDHRALRGLENRKKLDMAFEVIFFTD